MTKTIFPVGKDYSPSSLAISLTLPVGKTPTPLCPAALMIRTAGNSFFLNSHANYTMMNAGANTILRD